MVVREILQHINLDTCLALAVLSDNVQHYLLRRKAHKCTEGQQQETACMLLVPGV